MTPGPLITRMGSSSIGWSSFERLVGQLHHVGREVLAPINRIRTGSVAGEVAESAMAVALAHFRHEELTADV